MKKPSKHLTYEERCIIEKYLEQRQSIRYIARELNKSPSTILREIKKHTITFQVKQNDCKNRSTCKIKGICGDTSCKNRCKFCRKCKNHCLLYERQYCLYKTDNTQICNGCPHTRTCGYERRFYRAEKAHEQYRNELSSSRTGFDLTCEQLIIINDLVTPKIKQGQSPYHIMQSVGSSLSISESTLRRLIHSCELDVRNIDLHSQVRRRPRNKSDTNRKKREIFAKAKLGHLYEDFLKFVEDNDVNIVQMDCVEGIKTDNAVLLTLHLPRFHFQLAYIMEWHTSACVIQTLDKLEYSLGTDLFQSIFGVILTDNGHEFMDIEGMERSINGGQRTHIFFCEPNRSDEKGSCENNHKLIRYVIPKHTSLEFYTQFDINLMMNHINSYTRKSLFGKSPYTAAKQVLPADFFILLGLEEIPANEVNLTPTLIQK